MSLCLGGPYVNVPMSDEAIIDLYERHAREFDRDRGFGRHPDARVGRYQDRVNERLADHHNNSRYLHHFLRFW